MLIFSSGAEANTKFGICEFVFREVQSSDPLGNEAMICKIAVSAIFCYEMRLTLSALDLSLPACPSAAVLCGRFEHLGI